MTDTYPAGPPVEHVLRLSISLKHTLFPAAHDLLKYKPDITPRNNYQ
jgi:hypothetical protein